MFLEKNKMEPLKGMLMCIACLCPNLISVHFYILHFYLLVYYSDCWCMVNGSGAMAALRGLLYVFYTEC